MSCALAAAALAVTLSAVPSAPVCLRADRGVPPDVMAALVGGTARPAQRTDPAFEAAIRAIREPAPPARSRRR